MYSEKKKKPIRPVEDTKKPNNPNQPKQPVLHKKLCGANGANGACMYTNGEASCHLWSTALHWLCTVYFKFTVLCDLLIQPKLIPVQIYQVLPTVSVSEQHMTLTNNKKQQTQNQTKKQKNKENKTNKIIF